MSNHNFDLYQLQQWLAGEEKLNEEEVVKALMEIKQERIRRIIIEHIYEKRTFEDLGKEYGVSRQRAHQLYMKGIKRIKKKLGV